MQQLPLTHTATALVAVLLGLATTAQAQIVVLDPGHGGADPGAVGCMGLEEAPNVLDVADQARGILEAAGVRTEVTRDDDRFVELTARAAFANDLGATLFVSIHSNANAGTPATGSETWIANSASATSSSLAGLLQEEIIASWMLRDRGVKRANFTVLTATRMPAALTELCFTNNCDPDAALLRDPAQRLEIARAHARAILRQLGRDPGMVGTTGTLLGVVFEDLGVGLEDTSVRVPTASVVIDGDALTVDGTTAAWSATLPAGSYTVEASAPGFTPGTRTCAVTVGMETWCSVGLARVAATPDAGVPEVDAGTAPIDAGEPTDASVALDAGMEEPMEGCSCRVGASSRAGGAWIGLLFVLAWALRARRRSAVLALLALSACSPPGAASPSLTERGEDVATLELDAVEVRGFARLGPARPVAEALTAPVLSPDGARIAMSDERLRQLFVQDLATGERTLVAEAERAGYLPRWTADGRALRYRHPEQSGTAVPHHVVVLEGDAPTTPAATRHVWLDAERRVVLREGGTARVVSREGDRYLTPQLGADGRHVVYWGMSTGLFVYRIADGATVRIGEGAHPSLDPEGRWLVFERSVDDGHAIVASELWITDLADPRYRTAPLTDTRDEAERMPTIAAGRVAWATAEGVLVADVAFE